MHTLKSVCLCSRWSNRTDLICRILVLTHNFSPTVPIPISDLMLMQKGSEFSGQNLLCRQATKAVKQHEACKTKTSPTKREVSTKKEVPSKIDMSPPAALNKPVSNSKTSYSAAYTMSQFTSSHKSNWIFYTKKTWTSLCFDVQHIPLYAWGFGNICVVHKTCDMLKRWGNVS